MRLRSSLLCILLVAIPATGCKPEKKDDVKKDDDDRKDDKKGKKSGDAKSGDAKSADAPTSGEPKKGDAPPTSTASAPPPPADPTAAPPPTAAGGTTDTAPAPTPAPGGKSTVPTMDEWNAQTKEVTVLGSSKLNCETKQVREWVRISCRSKNDTGGEPTGVKITKGGGRGDDFVFSSAGVASLVYRFVEGLSMEAEFSWTDKTKTLVIAWPRGAPEPPAKAIFK